MKSTERDTRWEFRFLIRRCRCSRACLEITEEDVKEAKTMGIKMERKEPSCSPKTCFPNLYKMLYPKGGFPAISSYVSNYRIRNKKGINKA